MPNAKEKPTDAIDEIVKCLIAYFISFSIETKEALMSSSSLSPKRKRMPASTENPENTSTVDLLQPSSRDASGEDATEDSSVPTISIGVKHKKAIDSVGSSNPAPKRPRTKSSAAETISSNGIIVPTIQKEDPGESSGTTEESADIEKKSSLKKTSGKSALKESTPIERPAKGGIVDPVGYKTNPPPVGRPIRVYADGVACLPIRM